MISDNIYHLSDDKYIVLPDITIGSDVDTMFSEFWNSFNYGFDVSFPNKKIQTNPTRLGRFRISQELKREFDNLKQLNWFRKQSNNANMHLLYKQRKKL